MKTRTIRIAAMLIISLLAISNINIAQAKEKKNKKGEKEIQLFNGKDLNNWMFHLKDAAVDPLTVFTVQDGIIHIKGSPFGYMRTDKMYADYKLHVEWRWPSEGTNSGVFIHTQMPDAIWPVTIECQLQAGNAGDFICNGIEVDEHTDKSGKALKKMAASSEKPVGEWNTMDVNCIGNTIEVFVNGVLQNKGTNITVKKGFICLQSEGKDIEFKNVFLKKSKK